MKMMFDRQCVTVAYQTTEAPMLRGVQGPESPLRGSKGPETPLRGSKSPTKSVDEDAPVIRGLKKSIAFHSAKTLQQQVQPDQINMAVFSGTL